MWCGVWCWFFFFKQKTAYYVLISDWSSDVCSSYLDEQEQAQPHHVDEVPVPGHRLEREVVVLAEVALGAAQPDDREHDRAQGHVRTVEAGEHEERRAVDARTQGQVELGVGV